MNIKDFKASLPYLVKASITPFIWGHAGIGKTEVVKQFAKENGYHFFPFYLGAMSDVGDVLGLATFIKDSQGQDVATKFAMPIWLKECIEYCEQNPQSGAVIFLDEFNRGRRDILNGMFSFALDKKFHTIQLPENCHVIAAGNPPTDEYFTTDVNETALMARFVHVKLEPSFDEWAQFAESQNMDSRLTGFLKGQTDLLEAKRSAFELPVKVDRRSWSRLDKLFKLEVPMNLLEQLMHGIIGIERTVAYLQYLKSCDKPLTAKEVLSSKSAKTLEKWSNPENVVSSLLNLTMDNLKEYFMQLDDAARLTAKEKANLMRVFDTVPKDISYSVITSLAKAYKHDVTNAFKDFATDPLYEDRIVDLIVQLKGKVPEVA